MAKTPLLAVEIAWKSRATKIRRQIRDVVRKILTDAGIKTASISIAVVDDAHIHRLNRQYLNHDYPTDVLSFLLEEGAGHLEGEIIVSAETAARSSRDYRWSKVSELLLYIIHGTLHLVGYDDHSTTNRAAMRQKEQFYLEHLGIALPNTARILTRRRRKKSDD